MPHSIALFAALSGLGATAAHGKTEAGLDALFLQTSFADGAAASSSHVWAAPGFLKLAGKTATDFFTGIFWGVKTATASPSSSVCLSSASSPALWSFPTSVRTLGALKAFSTTLPALKATGTGHASVQLLALKHHAAGEGAAAAGHGPASAALHASCANDTTGGMAAHSFTGGLPSHAAVPAAGDTRPLAPAGGEIFPSTSAGATVPAAVAAAAPAAAGAAAPFAAAGAAAPFAAASAGPGMAVPAAAGAAASVGGIAKTAFGYKGAVFSAHTKGMLLCKTAAHGGHGALKTRSSFFGRNSKGGMFKRGGGSNASSRSAARAQKQAAKEARQREQQVKRQQREQQRQAQRQQREQQRQVQRQQREQQRQKRQHQQAQQRAYGEQRAESRRAYKQERDRLKQEQRQMRSLTRNELRRQREREQLAEARGARGAGGSPFYSSEYRPYGGGAPYDPYRGGGGAYRPYGGGAHYGAGAQYGGGAHYGRGSNYGGGSHYGGGAPYGGGTNYGGGYHHEGGYVGRPYGPEGEEYGQQHLTDDGVRDAGYYGGAAADHHYGGGNGEEAYAGSPQEGGTGWVPAETTQHVYAQPGNAEGLKSVTVVQDVAETKGGVTLHHVTETTSKARNILSPQGEAYAACCFVQFRCLTSTRVFHPLSTSAVPAGSDKAVHRGKEASEGDTRILVAAKRGGWQIIAAPVRSEKQSASVKYKLNTAVEECVPAAKENGAGERIKCKPGKGNMVLHSVKDEAETEKQRDHLEKGGKTRKENLIIFQTREAARVSLEVFRYSDVLVQSSKRYSTSSSVTEGLSLQRRQRGHWHHKTLLQQQWPLQEEDIEKYGIDQILPKLASSSSCNILPFPWSKKQHVDAWDNWKAEDAAKALREEVFSENDKAGKVGQKGVPSWRPYEYHVAGREAKTDTIRRRWSCGLVVGSDERSEAKNHGLERRSGAAQECQNVMFATAIERPASNHETATAAVAAAATVEKNSLAASVGEMRADCDVLGHRDKGDTWRIRRNISDQEAVAAANAAAGTANEGRNKALGSEKLVLLVHACRPTESSGRGHKTDSCGAQTLKNDTGNDSSISGSMSVKDCDLQEKRTFKKAQSNINENNFCQKTFDTLGMHAQNARHPERLVQLGVVAASVGGGEHAGNVGDVESAFALAASSWCAAAGPAAFKSLHTIGDQGHQFISGRRVQLSLLPFRKLMYSNFM